MASLELTEDEIVEARLRVDTRAKARDLPDSLLQGDLTLGVATDWAWVAARQGRVDDVGTTDDFETFLNGLSVLETVHFRRAVLNRLAGIVSESYRKIEMQDAGGIQREYGEGNTPADLFQASEDELAALRDLAPAGAYENGRQAITMLTTVKRC